MKITISWTDRPLDSEANELEKKLAEDAENHPFPLPCHEGVLAYHLNTTGDLLDQVNGRIACSCGKQIGGVKGRIDGSSLTFTRMLQ